MKKFLMSIIATSIFITGFTLPINAADTQSSINNETTVKAS